MLVEIARVYLEAPGGGLRGSGGGLRGEEGNVHQESLRPFGGVESVP
jgi:hypothetical protein